MSSGAHSASHRVHWPRRSVVLFLVGLVAAAGIGVGIDRAFFSEQARYSWPPKPCVVQGIDARCGTFVVPENRAEPNGRTIGLRVVVLRIQGKTLMLKPLLTSALRQEALADPLNFHPAGWMVAVAINGHPWNRVACKTWC